MAKDPAFLFYTNDFSTGTQFLTDDQLGKYMRLLMAQHQHGHLTESQVLFICKSYDNDILIKFKKDDNGLYYNERLEEEICKRKRYTESRSNNKSGRKKAINEDIKPEIIRKSYDYDMENRNRDINSNKEVIKKKGKVAFIPPSVEEVIQYFAQNGYSNESAIKAHSYYDSANWHDAKGNPVKVWKQKMQGVWFKEENRVGQLKASFANRGAVTDIDEIKRLMSE